jgi:uncharacterized membrane protein
MAATCHFFGVNRRCPTLRPALPSEIPAHYMRHSMFALKWALMNLCSCIVHLVTISSSYFLEAGGSTSLVSKITVFSIAAYFLPLFLTLLSVWGFTLCPQQDVIRAYH